MIHLVALNFRCIVRFGVCKSFCSHFRLVFFFLADKMGNQIPFLSEYSREFRYDVYFCLLSSLICFICFLSFLFVPSFYCFLLSRGQEGKSDPVIGREIKRCLIVLTFCVSLTAFLQVGYWTGAADIPPAVPFLSVRIWMPGVCSAGCVGGQATQPGSTRTPSPSVQLGGVGWSPLCPTRGRR